MATSDQYIETAASYIGIGGTDNIFNTWYWGFHCYDPGLYPWCAAFQSYVGVEDLNMPFTASASASGVAWQGDRVPDSEARKGDWVLFNWDGRQDFGWADHIGVVEWSDISGSGLFGTIEGNTGNAYGGEVARCTRNNNAGYATAFFRPPFVEAVPEQVPGSPENDFQFLYRMHVQNLGWCEWVRDGQVAGTTGFALRAEAIEFDPPEGVELTVKAHIQNEGWKTFTGIKKGSHVIVGSTGKEQRLEMISIIPVKLPKGIELQFRVHQQDVGWKQWTPQGYASGSDGEASRLEALQAKLVRS